MFKRILSGSVLSLTLMSAHMLHAASGLQYACKVSSWDFKNGAGNDCGTVILSMGSDADLYLQDCNVKVIGGSASGSTGEDGMNVIMGTPGGLLSGENFGEMTSLLLYPSSAPKGFHLSLISGNVSYDLDCSVSN